MSAVENMESMFAYGVYGGDVSAWDVSSVENMRDMFRSNYVFDGDLSEWDVSSVTSFSGMFQASQCCTSNVDWCVSDIGVVTTNMFLFAACTMAGCGFTVSSSC